MTPTPSPIPGGDDCLADAATIPFPADAPNMTGDVYWFFVRHAPAALYAAMLKDYWHAHTRAQREPMAAYVARYTRSRDAWRLRVQTVNARGTN